VHAKHFFDVALPFLKSLGAPTNFDSQPTDADSRRSNRLDTQTEAEIAKGVVGVGGRITLPSEETVRTASSCRNVVPIFSYWPTDGQWKELRLALRPRSAMNSISQASPALRRKFRCHAAPTYGGGMATPAE